MLEVIKKSSLYVFDTSYKEDFYFIHLQKLIMLIKFQRPLQINFFFSNTRFLIKIWYKETYLSNLMINFLQEPNDFFIKFA